ncbi:hypothetical protein HA402_005953 [Bradysia odoriphaga]|nr:hypothetical protein HA402_005953 [Bradysia odoriphaga]
MMILRSPSKRKRSQKYIASLDVVNKRAKKENSFAKPPQSEKRSGEEGIKKELKNITEKCTKLEIENEALKLSQGHLEESLEKSKTENAANQMAADLEIKNLNLVIEKSLEAIEELQVENYILKSKEKFNKNLPIESRDVASQVSMQENFDSVLNVVGETCEVKDFNPKDILKINSPPKFTNLELALLEDKNIEVLSNHYLRKICQNNEKEYMQQLALQTFEKSFLEDVSFKKGCTSVYMKGSNLLKCWIETIKIKFYESSRLSKNEAEKIAKEIQDSFRVLKNTLSQQ